MKRILTLCTIILLFGALLPAHPAQAHAIVSVNGAKDTNEWLAGFGSNGCPALPSANSSSIYGSAQGCTGPVGNEYIWTDATGDRRTDVCSDTYGDLDLKEFRLTGDPTYVSFLLEFADITNCGKQYIAIAINSSDSGGTAFFPDNADTDLAGFGSGYERVIEANTVNTGYWTNNTTYTAVDNASFCNADNNLWEIRFSTSDLGLTWPANSGAYDFAVAVFCQDSGAPWDVGGSSDVIDVITAASSTWAEVIDGDVDYNFTMEFGPTAVELIELTARPASAPQAAPWLLGAGVLLVAGLLAWRKRG